jgi:hypothetical protein
MLDFHSRVQPRNYFSRREQRRLFAWVMGIGLLVIACASVVEVGRFARSPSGAAASGSVAVDTRFEPKGDRTGEPGAVTIVKAEEPENIANGDALFPGVDPELLAQVRDDTPWIRSNEVEAWLNVWSALRRSNDESLAHRSPVGFLELFQQPRAFRGKLVTVRGSARQAMYVSVEENAHGIEGYYRVIVRPDRGPEEPIFLYTLELPANFPTGEQIRAEIEATGVFFKRMVYPTKDNQELRRAPVVMARTLAWHQPKVREESRGGSSVGILVALVAVGIVGFVAATYWASRVGVSTAERRPSALPPIDDGDVVSVEESLSKLAETER